jgi:fibronectin-binding autotransporter adhesin
MTGAPSRRLILATAIALLALDAASGARAGCTANVAGDHVFALAGDDCVASGAYDPTVPTPPGAIVGLFAQNGGVITAAPEAGFITVNANDAAGSYAIWSEGAGETGSSLIDLAVPVTVTTSGSGSIGLYASGGGTIATPEGLGVTMTGASSVGVRASGPASTIAVTGATIVANDPSSIGVQADGGGVVTLSGGSVTLEAKATGDAALFATGSGSKISTDGTAIVTNGPGALGAVSVAGGAVELAGGSVTTNGAGSAGIATLFGSISATGTTITTSGSVDVAGDEAAGVLIEGAGATSALTGDTIKTSGFESDGVLAQAGGHATLSGVNGITTTGDGSIGLHAVRGGVIDATGGSVTTSGIGAPGLSVDGPGSKIMASNVAVTTNGGFDLSTESFSFGLVASNGGSATVSGGSITTNGPVAHGVFAFNGGDIALSTGTTVLTTGGGSFGLFVNGAGSSLTATDVSVTTTGGIGPTFGNGAIGAYNGSASPGDPTGGTMTLTGTTIATTGVAAVGVETNSGGVTNISGGAVNTSGQDAHALFVTGAGSTVNLSGATAFATRGDGAIGLYATQGGIIDALGQTTIATSGAKSASTGLSAYGVNADGAGSQINLAATTITTTGAGAAGLYASDIGGTGHGGAITVGGPLSVLTGGSSAYGVWAQGAGSTITLNGPSAIALNGDRTTGLLAAAGGAILSNGPTSIAVSGAGSTGVQALSGAVAASGALNVTTSQASSTAFALSGTSPSILATGGGTVSAAGNAIALADAVGAVATFDHFNIKSSGDLIFADPSIATVNFNNTVANAGAGNLLNATLGSVIAFNANASTLTGAIQTDPTSVTNVSLANGSNWAMTASSTATSLNLANSAIVFSPSGGFKTLTVGSYFGTGANIALNTALGGPNAGSTDQLIINGGSATGLTALTVKNASGTGAATIGAGIPVVVVTKGGTTAPGAFYLADNAPVLAGGLEYTLGRGSNQDWYLTSSPAPTAGDIQNSVTSIAKAQLNQLITTRLLGSLLLGANQQVSGCDCGGGFGSIGSFGLGANGRWALSDSVTLLAGAAFEQFYQDGANVSAAPIVAASLRYDPANWGKSRPFFEFGGALSPYIDATYTRYYTNGLTPAQGVGSAVDRSVSVFGRIGWVDRLTPIDEVAVFGDVVRGWQQSGGYTEAASPLNPFPATVSTGVDRQDIVRFGATYTHLLFGNLEANINGAIAYGFDNEFGSRINVVSFGSVAPYPLLNSAWTEFGGRLGYRFSRNLVVDAFLIGTLGGEIGPTLHAGLGVRYAF